MHTFIGYNDFESPNEIHSCYAVDNQLLCTMLFVPVWCIHMCTGFKTVWNQFNKTCSTPGFIETGLVVHKNGRERTRIEQKCDNSISIEIWSERGIQQQLQAAVCNDVVVTKIAGELANAL